MKNTKHSICLEQMGRPKSSSELVPVEAAKWTPKLEHVCMKSDFPIGRAGSELLFVLNSNPLSPLLLLITLFWSIKLLASFQQQLRTRVLMHEIVKRN